MKRYIRSSADDALIYNEDDDYTIASQIAMNNKAEWDAIEGYQKLIPFLEARGDSESVDHIREIISDELNHAEILREIMSKYDGNIPTNKE